MREGRYSASNRGVPAGAQLRNRAAGQERDVGHLRVATIWPGAPYAVAEVSATSLVGDVAHQAEDGGLAPRPSRVAEHQPPAQRRRAGTQNVQEGQSVRSTAAFCPRRHRKLIGRRQFPLVARCQIRQCRPQGHPLMLAAGTLGLPTSPCKFCNSWEELQAAIDAGIGFTPASSKPVMSSSGRGRKSKDLSGPADVQRRGTTAGGRPREYGRVIVRLHRL